MSLARSALRPLRAAPAPSSSRAASTRAAKPVVQWKSKTHTRPAPGLPLPLPAIFPQRVVLSDGSTFTSYTTAPSPAIVRLARDVTNNPLWAPGTHNAAASEDDEGAVGRFRRRFAAADAEAAADAAPAFKADDLAWMSDGAKEETVSDKERAGRKKTKGKKK
ncbi:hypothetical protein VHUM_01367 [Vanrija humicola]|uniref:Uncharacterized protein n=1 Tax=Vanrija humicola TaxID=5417 RepID=A0A7D8V374_VANHU|nr:hypothetical protein VHUM_01367 [Vanrija humicola]